MTNVKGPIISFADLPSIETYLSAHEGSESGFWLKLAKAGAPEATITKAQAIEAALCHGWIDGQLGKFDEHYYLVRMTPRRSASRWSAINRDTAERLIREARMQPAGLSEVQKAKADGRWSAAYQSQGKAEPPSDFLAALRKDSADWDSWVDLALMSRGTTQKRAIERANRLNPLEPIHR